MSSPVSIEFELLFGRCCLFVVGLFLVCWFLPGLKSVSQFLAAVSCLLDCLSSFLFLFGVVLAGVLFCLFLLFVLFDVVRLRCSFCFGGGGFSLLVWLFVDWLLGWLGWSGSFVGEFVVV